MTLKDFASHFVNMLHIKLSFRKCCNTSQINYLRYRLRSQKQEIALKCVIVLIFKFIVPQFVVILSLCLVLISTITMSFKYKQFALQNISKIKVKVILAITVLVLEWLIVSYLPCF